MTLTVTHAVLGVVFGLVLLYWFRCWKLINQRQDNPRARLEKLRGRLKSDIRTLVRSGRSLDWVHYSDEAHRGQEDLREHLRNYGTISLATGVGGTMLALALYLLLAGPSQGDAALEGLLREMGWALGASFTGVIGNLVILWGLLPWANRIFNPELDRFLNELRDQETRSATREASGPTAAETIGNRLGKELRSAIARVPKVFEQFGETVTTLGVAADKLDTDVTKLTSASENLARSTASLNRMPEELDTVLGKALTGLSTEAETLLADLRAWESERQSAAAESHAKLQSAIAKARSQHDEAADRLKEMAQAVADSADTLPGRVAAAVNDGTTKLADANRAVQKSVDALPGKVTVALEASGKSLGHQFDDAVEQHVKRFRDGMADGLRRTTEWQNAVSGHLEEARKQHDRAIYDLVAKTTDVDKTVQGLPDAVAEGVETISDKLGRQFGVEARNHVADLRSALKEDAEQLRRNLERHESHLLNTTVQELRKVSEELVNTTVRDLDGISEKLAAILDGFPEHVGAVNTKLDDAEAALKDILAGFVDVSDGLRTAHDNTSDMLAKLVESARDQKEATRELTKAIRERSPWWRRLFGRSRAKTRGAPPTQGES